MSEEEIRYPIVDGKLPHGMYISAEGGGGKPHNSIFARVLRTIKQYAYVSDLKAIAELLDVPIEKVEDWERQAVREVPDHQKLPGAVEIPQWGIYQEEVRLDDGTMMDKKDLMSRMIVDDFPIYDADGRYTGKFDFIWCPDPTHPLWEFQVSTGSSAMDPVRKAAYLENFKKNAEKSGGFKKSVKKLDGECEGEHLLIIGNGPSLVHDWEMLKQICAERKSLGLKTMGCNRAINYLGADAIDYYVVVDYTSFAADWLKAKGDRSGVKIIADAFSHPWVNEVSEPYWMWGTHDRDEVLPDDGEGDRSYRKRIGVVGGGVNVFLWSMVLAYRFLKPKSIIMVGCDHAYTDMCYHPGREWHMDQFDNPVFPADQEFVAGKKGFVAVTDGRLKRAANMLAGLIFYIVNGGYPAGCRRSIPVYDACDRGMDLRFAKEIGLTEVYTDILLKKEEVASGILCTR